MTDGRMIDIAPSILSADFSRLGEEIAAVERGGATILHVDVMSVNPGFDGQQFIPGSIQKVHRLKRMIDEQGLSTRIEIDGGIDRSNIERVVAAGADIIVAGSAIFGTGNAEAAARELRE